MGLSPGVTQDFIGALTDPYGAGAPPANPLLPGYQAPAAAPMPVGSATTPGATGATGGGGTSPSSAQLAESGYWANQNGMIDAALGRLPNQLDVGNTNALNAYSNAYQRLMNDKSTAERNYNTARTQTMQDKQQADAQIHSATGQQLTGLQRLLGSRGFGNSSAASILAPIAAGREGNVREAQVGQTFGRNMGGLDTGWADAVNQFDTSTGDLGAQRDAALNANTANADKTRAGLLQQKGQATANQAMAMGDYAGANAARGQFNTDINTLLGQIDSLGLTPTYTPKAVNVKPIDLSQYNYSNFGTPTINNGSQGQDVTSNYLGPFMNLLGQKDKNAVGAAA